MSYTIVCINFSIIYSWVLSLHFRGAGLGYAGSILRYPLLVPDLDELKLKLKDIAAMRVMMSWRRQNGKRSQQRLAWKKQRWRWVLALVSCQSSNVYHCLMNEEISLYVQLDMAKKGVSCVKEPGVWIHQNIPILWTMEAQHLCYGSQTVSSLI